MLLLYAVTYKAAPALQYSVPSIGADITHIRTIHILTAVAAFFFNSWERGKPTE